MIVGCVGISICQFSQRSDVLLLPIITGLQCPFFVALIFKEFTPIEAYRFFELLHCLKMFPALQIRLPALCMLAKLQGINPTGGLSIEIVPLAPPYNEDRVNATLQFRLKHSAETTNA